MIDPSQDVPRGVRVVWRGGGPDTEYLVVGLNHFPQRGFFLDLEVQTYRPAIYFGLHKKGCLLHIYNVHLEVPPLTIIIVRPKRFEQRKILIGYKPSYPDQFSVRIYSSLLSRGRIDHPLTRVLTKPECNQLTRLKNDKSDKWMGSFILR